MNRKLRALHMDPAEPAPARSDPYAILKMYGSIVGLARTYDARSVEDHRHELFADPKCIAYLHDCFPDEKYWPC